MFRCNFYMNENKNHLRAIFFILSDFLHKHKMA